MNIIGKSALIGVTGRFVQNRTLPEGGVSRMWGEEGASDMTGQSMAVGGRGWRGSCARLKNGDRWSGTGDRCGGYQPTWRPRRYRQVGADTGGGEADPGGACSRRSSPSKPTITRFCVRIALVAVMRVTSRTGGFIGWRRCLAPWRRGSRGFAVAAVVVARRVSAGCHIAGPRLSSTSCEHMSLL